MVVKVMTVFMVEVEMTLLLEGMEQTILTGLGSDKATDYNSAEGDSFINCEIVSRT
jgi:hypothetical protein